MVLLTNIHDKASNHRHYGTSLLSFLLICEISQILITNIVSLVLFLKCHHQNFQLLSDKITFQDSLFYFFGKPTVSWQQFSTLSIAVIGNVHQGTSCEQIDHTFHSRSHSKLIFFIILRKGGTHNIMENFGNTLYIIYT